MNKKITIDGMSIWVDFRDDEERLESSVLIYTQVFNERLGLADNQWGCFVVPAGSSTNGASWSPITTLLLWLHKRDPTIRLAALGHDEMYRSAGKNIVFTAQEIEVKPILLATACKLIVADGLTTGIDVSVGQLLLSAAIYKQFVGLGRPAILLAILAGLSPNSCIR